MTLFDRLRRWWSGPEPTEAETITCHDALERLQEYLDGELVPASREEVEVHFEICERCYPHLRLEERFRERVLSALRGPEMPETLRSRVLQTLPTEER